MAVVHPSQDSWVRGEISPRLHARASLELYRSALGICENFVTLPHGGMRKRPGTYFAGEAKVSAPARLVPFVFSETQAYMLIFGGFYFQVYAYGGPVLDGPSVIDVVTPYTDDAIADLQFETSGDVLYVTHPDYEPRKITRTSATVWTLSTTSFEDGPFAPQNADEIITMYASAASGTVTLTASAAVFLAKHIGQLVKLQVLTYETWKPWESGGFLTADTAKMAAGTLLRRYNGNIYQATEPATWTGKLFMGGTPPSHIEGKEWDGAGDDQELFDGTAAHNANYGVKWLYQHSGFGIARITAIGGGGTTATATVLTDFPAEVVGSGNASYRWSFGGFSGGGDGYPRSSCIYEERLFFGQQYSVYGSKPFDVTSFRAGAADDDALAFQLAGSSDITWLEESDGFLLVGTIGGVRALSGGGSNEPLSPSSFKNRASPTKRCSSIPPVKAGGGIVYVGFDRKSVVEMSFSLERNGFQTAPLGLISEHIPKKGISSISHQSEPDSIFWMALQNGELAGLTYEADQNVRGWHRHHIGGTSSAGARAFVDAVATTPGATGSDDVWLIVGRIIGGVVKRYIEVLQPPFEYGEVEDAFMVDCGLSYDGVATNSVSGVTHLAGESVSVLADAIIYRDLEVSGVGVVTLPGGVTASKWHVGLPYTAVAETLELDVGGRDGSLIGRKKRALTAVFSVLESANIDVKSLSRPNFETERAGRVTLVPESGEVTLFTGNLDPVYLEDSWASRNGNGGRLRIEAPDPVPCTIRAMVIGFDSEGS